MRYHVNEIIPVLETTKMKETIVYYRDVLHFSIEFLYPNEEQPNHAGFSIGGGVDNNATKKVFFHISDADEQVNPCGWLFINVNDIDKIYADMQRHGANITVQIDNFPWGYREFEVQDINGHKFRYTKELPHERL